MGPGAWSWEWDQNLRARIVTQSDTFSASACRMKGVVERESNFQEASGFHIGDGVSFSFGDVKEWSGPFLMPISWA